LSGNKLLPQLAELLFFTYTCGHSPVMLVLTLIVFIDSLIGIRVIATTLVQWIAALLSWIAALLGNLIK
jgi:hypothetical protein